MVMTLLKDNRDVIIRRIKESISLLCSKYQKIALIYLHGSFQEKIYTPLSDIDLAFYYLDIDNKLTEMLELIDFFSFKLPDLPIDIKILNDAPIDFCFRAINGELLYVKDEDIRVDFETRTISRYLDFKPIIDYYLHKQLEIIRGDNFEG